MSGHDGEDVALFVKLQFVNAHLAVETVDGFRVVVTMIDNVIFPLNLNDGVVARSMHRFVQVGCEQFTFVGEGSHWPHSGCGVLHTICVGVAGA